MTAITDLCPRCKGDHDRIDSREPCPACQLPQGHSLDIWHLEIAFESGTVIARDVAALYLVQDAIFDTLTLAGGTEGPVTRITLT